MSLSQIDDLNLVTDRAESDIDEYDNLQQQLLTNTSISPTESNSIVRQGLGIANSVSTSDLSSCTGHKGAYTHTDINRVIQACSIMQQELESTYGIHVDITTIAEYTFKHTVNTNGTYSHMIPTQSEMTAYINNIKNLKAVLVDQTTAPTIPDNMNNLTYTTANNIEKVILLLKSQCENTSWFYSGEVYCGEV